MRCSTHHVVARYRLAVVLVVIAILIASTAIVGAYEIIPQRNVSNDAARSVKPRVAQDTDGNVHVVWDSAEGGRKVMYAKAIWNGTSYDFTPKRQVADVGGFQYASPNIFVGANNQVMIAWSDRTVKVITFDANAVPPSGAGTALGGGINPTIGADYAGRFHIVWDGDFAVQYCEFVNNACGYRQALDASEGSLRPDVAVDINNTVYLLWEGGNTIKVRNRPAGSGTPLDSTEAIGRGNFGNIAVDGTGAIHIIRSNNYNAVYCRKDTAEAACVDEHIFDFAADLEPSIGATKGGNVLVVFRDDANDVLVINARENGTWSASREFASSTTQVDLTQRPYVERFSVVWSRDFDIIHGGFRIACGGGSTTGAAAATDAATVGPAQTFALPIQRYLPAFEVLSVPQAAPPATGC